MIRKRLVNVSLEARLPATAYDKTMTARVYDAMRSQAAVLLKAGCAVVVDATFLHAADRKRMAEVARGQGVGV